MNMLHTTSPPNQQPLHVCLVTETYPPEVNGVAMTLQRFVTGLISKGHHVSLVRPRQQTYDRPGCCLDPTVTLVRGIPLPGYKGVHIGLASSLRIRSIWENNRPDVIYIATEGPLGFAALKAAKRLSIPVTSGFHTNFHTYMKHYRIGMIKSLVLNVLRNFHNDTAATLVPSPDLHHQLIDQGFKNVHVVSRGVDCDLFNPDRRDNNIRSAWGVSDDDLVTIHVGRLAAEKNIELFLTAFRKMKQVSSRLKAVIIGDGPIYKKLVKDNPDVIFCGMQRGRKLAAYYASADIFLFPSETETFGNVLLEAMASELAVVAYDYAAANIHVTHNDNGLSVPLTQESRFIEAAVSLVKEKALRSRLRSRARQHVLKHDWVNVIDKFERILETSIKQHVS